MRYEIRITENVQTWKWSKADGRSLPVMGTEVSTIVPDGSGYTAYFQRIACNEAELKEAVSLAHRYGREWAEAHPLSRYQDNEEDDGADQSDYAPMGDLNALRAALREGR